MAPVGLLLCIICLDLPGKQALQETALLLRYKYFTESKSSHCSVSKGNAPSLFFKDVKCKMQTPGSWKVLSVSVQQQNWTSLHR